MQFLMLICLLTPVISFGATNNELLEDIKSNTSGIKNKQESFWDTYLSKYLKVDESTANVTPATPNLNTTLLQTITSKRANMSSSATADTQGIINMNLNGQNLFGPYTSAGGGFYGITPVGESNPALDASLNVDSILNYDAISGLSTADKLGEIGLPAANFPILLTQAVSAEPVKTPDSMSEDAYKIYIGGIWAENAQRSIALSNIYQLLREREIIPGLGAEAGMKESNGATKNDASIMEVEEFLIKNRVGNPDWYTAMESASPIQIERESLYVLAEIQRLLHLTRKQNERITVAVSALISQGIDLRRTLSMMAEATLSASEAASNIEIPEDFSSPNTNTGGGSGSDILDDPTGFFGVN